MADDGQLLTIDESPTTDSTLDLRSQHLDKPIGDPVYWRWLALISLIGTVLRLWDLDGIGIWGDELFEAREAIRVSRLNIVDTLEGFVGHATVLLGLLVAGADLSNVDPNDYGAFQDAGITAPALRLAPAVIGSLTVPVVGVLSRRFLGRRESLLFALMLAVAPWHLYWSQSARFYAVQFLFYAIAFFLYFDATERGSPRRLAVAMLAFTLAFNAQYTSFVFLVVIAGDWLFGRLTGNPPRLGPRGFAIVGLALACCAAMPLFLLFRVDTYVTSHVDVRGNPPHQIAAGIVMLVHPVVVGTAMITATVGGLLTPRKRVYLFLGAVLPIVIMSALSFRSFSGSRYGFVALMPMLALAAVGLIRLYDILRLKVNRLAAALPALLVLGTLLMADADFFALNRGFRPQWENAAESVRAQHEQGEKVAVSLTQVGHYLLDDLGQDVVIGTDHIEQQNAGVWVISTRHHSQKLLDRSAVEPSHWVQSFLTYYIVPRHEIDVWYRPPPDGQRAVPPAPDLP